MTEPVPQQCDVAHGGVSQACENSAQTFANTFNSSTSGTKYCTDDSTKVIHSLYDNCGAYTSCISYINSICQAVTKCPSSACAPTPSNSLSGGAIAVIVIICVLILVMIIYFKYKSHSNKRANHERTLIHY